MLEISIIFKMRAITWFCACFFRCIKVGFLRFLVHVKPTVCGEEVY